MNPRHSLLLAAVASLIGITIFVGPTGPPGADAEQIHLPIVGRQFITVGAEVKSGAVVDYSADELETSPTVGPRARLGLHHVVSERLSMNLEIALGASYLTDHPMAPGGHGPARLALDWGLAGVGRYMAIGKLHGWTFGGGLQFRRATLDTGTLLQLGLDGRLGYAIWTGDERFIVIELGLHVPFIEGVRLPSEFLVDDIEREPIPGQWIYPTTTLGIQWAF